MAILSDGRSGWRVMLKLAGDVQKKTMPSPKNEKNRGGGRPSPKNGKGMYKRERG